jgi:hypothetical protein
VTTPALLTYPSAPFTAKNRSNSRLDDEPGHFPVPRAVLDQLQHLKVLRHLQRRSIDEDEVRAVRYRVRKSNGVEDFHHDLLALFVLGDLRVPESILETELDTSGDGFLRGRGAGEDDASGGGEGGGDEMLGSAEPSDSPSSRSERFSLRD